ncbi:MAG: ABC transporter permease [Patescibacteria group bacterium]|jgi:ABC-2 type transport system permease protein
MNKFIALLKKEIKELITPQVVVPLVVSAVLFFALGNIIGKEAEKIKEPIKIVVLDQDRSASSRSVIDILGQNNFKVTPYQEIDAKQAVHKAKEIGVNVVATIPSGFGEAILSGRPQTVETYSIMRNFSFMGARDSLAAKAAIASLNNAFSDQVISSSLPQSNPADLKNPLKQREFVVIGNSQAEVGVEAVTAFVSQQSTFIPIILFMVIMMAAQMVMTAMATEKENKTLETLLSAPISRRSIVGAKMLAAAIVAFVYAIVYMFGFRSYLNGLTGVGTGATDEAMKGILSDLGLRLGANDYILLGLSLFGSILVALAIALILGAFTEDVKSVQGAITPLMVLMVIPYILVLFLDFNSLSPSLRWLVYAIPFSHPFLAAPNLFLGNVLPVIYGIVYEFVVFFLFLSIAAKIFSTDKIMTLKLSFGKKP